MTPRTPASERLLALVAARGPTCLGFDPRIDQLPDDVFVGGSRPSVGAPADAARAFERFFEGCLDAVGDAAAAVKLQAAFFEQYLEEGFAAFVRCCRTARERGYFVVADVKRGDISTTAEAYAEGYFGPVGGAAPVADAVTVNPYLGADGLEPFLTAAERTGSMVFVLVKTSNPSSKELQDLETPGGARISDRVAAWVEREAARTAAGGRYGAAAAVVGATHPAELAHFREAMPHAWMLLPGYGAQGAGARDVVGAFDAEGGGALVTASRSLTYPWGKGRPPADWRRAVADAARVMRADIATARGAR
ncbi:MAG TPA: orotidine-5'-phosphate decarboxylase [Planctomycetota bacterium]|nr:orotidine-5'-phosphate decarboxylase [Planctomycetota bacterium]